MDSTRFDTVIAGGGLQSGLLVLALRARHPDLRIAVVERRARLGGNHTWCFHTGDLSPAANDWCAPLVTHRWDGYDVQFDDLSRRLDHPYAAVTSDSLHEVVRRSLMTAPSGELRLDRQVVELDADRVVLNDGTELAAELVIDARGLSPSEAPPDAGYQKFLGLELELASDHPLECPLLMDARVDQSEGFRFFYVLPLGPRRLLIEDTRFHHSPELEHDLLRTGVLAYAEAKGWKVSEVLREETGVLPMPWRSPSVRADAGPLRAGYRGGWFHPATGYSFPVAARLAEAVAEAGPRAVRQGALGPLARAQEGQCRFARILNRLLFCWYPPAARANIFERFYRLPDTTIARFYALQTTARDRARILLGRPPAGLSVRYRFASGVSS